MRKKFVSAVLVSAMVLGALSGCAPKPVDDSPAQGAAAQPAAGGENTADTADLPELKVAVMPFLNSLPVEYMIDNGLEVKNGFKIKTVYFANGGAMNKHQ